MSNEEKSKKVFKLKTLDEIQKDTVYEIRLFSSKKRLAEENFDSMRKTTEENEDQVRRRENVPFFNFVSFRFVKIITDSDNAGEDSDDELTNTMNEKLNTTTGQKQRKQRKVCRK